MDCSCNHLLESLAIHAIALLFNETLEDLIAFSFSSSSFSSDDSETEEIIHIMKVIASTRYLDNQEPIQKSGAILDLCLNVYKLTRPKEFRKFAQMSPKSFYFLVQSLENEKIFQNNSAHEQISIDQQVFIALIKFRSYGNRASISKIDFLCGVGYSTVDLVTRRVITAVQSSNLGCEHIQWPSGEEKKAAKDWVEEHTGTSI